MVIGISKGAIAASVNAVDMGGLVLSAPASAYNSSGDYGAALWGLVAPLASPYGLLAVAPQAGGVDVGVLEVASDGSITAGTKSNAKATGTTYDNATPGQVVQKGFKMGDAHAAITYTDSSNNQYTQIIESDGADGIDSVGTADSEGSGAAKGDITALEGGKVVTRVDNGNSSAYKAHTRSDVTLTSGSKTSSNTDDQAACCLLTDSLMIMADRNGDAFWADISGTSITECDYADRVAFETSSQTNGIEVERLSDTVALVMWRVSGQNYPRARLVQYDSAGGGSLSLIGTEQTFVDAGSGMTDFCLARVPGTTTPRFLVGVHDSTNKVIKTQAFEIDGTTFTKGTAVDFGGGDARSYNFSIAPLSPTQALLQYCDTGSNRVEVVTVQMAAS